mmetsp:Transcript_46392/g.68501  ORF Transcript_46392/g.68501 Transcript_46392/m.68501 type:complete len:410 (-) Transcript_46392:197-1426(-)
MSSNPSESGCATPGCNNKLEQKLACPKCIQLGIPPAYYCSQACFKKSYSSHKGIHKLAKQILDARKGSCQLAPPGSDGVTCPLDAPDSVRHSLPNWAQSYNFTGSLRPHLLSPTRVLPDNIRRTDYADHPDGVSHSEQYDRASNTSIRVYGDKELDEGLRHAAKMGREVLDIAGKALRVGVTTDEIDRVVHEACIERECYPSPLNYYNFPKSVCTSVNEVICHGIPDYREIEDGDIVNIDITTYCRGYHGDLNETFLVGNVDEDGERLVKTAFECLQGALAMVKPGTLYRDLGNTIHRIATKNGCSVNRTYCGHGIGSLFHTAPNVPHYQKNKAKGIMKPGHVFTVEPMINLGRSHDVTWGDNWTAVTADGSRSAQFEHTVLVTKTGCEILTARNDEPVMTWNKELVQR